jgi:hypothetical protein
MEDVFYSETLVSTHKLRCVETSKTNMTAIDLISEIFTMGYVGFPCRCLQHNSATLPFLMGGLWLVAMPGFYEGPSRRTEKSDIFLYNSPE